MPRDFYLYGTAAVHVVADCSLDCRLGKRLPAHVSVSAGGVTKKYQSLQQNVT